VYLAITSSSERLSSCGFLSHIDRNRRPYDAVENLDNV
jgi:hypothetical protein